MSDPRPKRTAARPPLAVFLIRLLPQDGGVAFEVRELRGPGLWRFDTAAELQAWLSARALGAGRDGGLR